MGVVSRSGLTRRTNTRSPEAQCRRCGRRWVISATCPTVCGPEAASRVAGMPGRPSAASIGVHAWAGSRAMARLVFLSTGQPTVYSTRMPGSSPSAGRLSAVTQLISLWVAPAPSAVMSRLRRHGSGIWLMARVSSAM